MGIFYCCGKKKRSKTKKKEDDVNKPRGVFAFTRDGQKREQDMCGQDFYHMYGFEVDSAYIRFIGVYDGHGERGKEASQFVGLLVGNYLINNKNAIRKWNTKEIVQQKFIELYKKTQRQMAKNREMYELSGTCGISALVIDKFCFVINCGDSRAVIGSKGNDTKFAIQMSTDHKPNNFEEQERIVKMGGEVTNVRDGQYGPYRVYKNNGESVPGLAIARSVGDLVGHECGVSEVPQISFKIIDSQDEFIVIGSDGVFDMMNSVEIVGYIFERMEDVGRERIAEEIVEECRKRWILINKYKDEAFMERILADSNINVNTKAMIQSSFNQQSQGNTNTTAGSFAPVITANNASFSQLTGLHNIDDITCVILFFKS